MIYEDVDPQLLAFLHDPLATLEALDIERKRPNWLTRMLYKVPALRRFICSEQVQWLVLEKLSAGLAKSKRTLPQHLFEDTVALNEKTMSRLTDQLSKYFRIGITLVENEADSSERLAMLNAFIQANTWAKLEYTCNRIAENLQLRAEHNLAILSNANLWLGYYLSEVYFLMAHGLLSARLEGKTLSIVPTATLQRRLKGHWLAEICEANSKISDMRTLLDMALVLQRLGHLPPSAREPLIAHVLDKCLSIHANYLSANVIQHPQYQYLREIVYFATYLELRVMLGERITPEAQLQSCVSPATISMINSALSGQAPTLNSASSFIEYKGNTYVRGALSFKYGLRKFVGQLLGKALQGGNGQDFRGVLGIGFEADYIVNYIRNLDDPRFKVYGELKPGNRSKVKGYDIDLVLQDVEEDIYYFIQVKYRLSNLPTYLSEQCRLFSEPEFRKGFVKQLATLRDNLTDDSIRQKLSSHGLANAHAHNSHFILLHNIPFLNFYELDGIFFYEWNLLRNILRDGRVQFRKDQELTEGYVLSKPRLHQPGELVNAYLSHPQDGARLADHYDIYSRASAQFVYDDLDIVCKLI
ncbi:MULTISPECIES: hypothetical protein [Pseudomonas]|uniref:hypothetical protein n=1 Tax=Pseudomonas TaxID=286 RepID=UPI0018AC0389|nr:hypothetical protein [Pseudomonas putida]MBF8710003.1 hypothetical protein [Pseudomonas putida]